MSPERVFVGRLIWITAAALLVSVVWRGLPLVEAALVGWRAEPRTVAARGELASDERATIALFESAKDSVVFISTRRRVVDYWTRNAYDVPRGTGSGFVWDELGHVVTNDHVLRGASAATVRLADGRAYPAQLVGRSPAHDLAVLRIRVGPDRPPPAAVGASGELRVGQKVFAIGNPFGLDWTLTTGVVSALERELPREDGGTIEGLIQTDAAINPGNSGGPLLDSAGRLIGVNTAIYSPSGGSAGIGFAVPVDVVNRVVPRLIATGRYAVPTLGVRVDPRLNEVAARRLGIEGLVVLGVQPGSPAERAGLRPARPADEAAFALGDVIVAVAGRRVTSLAELQAALEPRATGDTVSITILRNGAELDVEMTL